MQQHVSSKLTLFAAAALSTATLLASWSTGATVLLDHFNGSTVGTAFGHPSFVSGPVGLKQAIQLDSTNYIQYALPTSLESQGTIEMFLDPTTYDASIMNFNWNDTTSYPAAGHVLHLKLNSVGDITIGGWAWNPADMYSLTSSASIPLGQWSHVALSWSTTGADIYVDGVLSASSNQPWQPANPLWAYLNYWGGTNLGKVDELRISDVQLTGAQISADAQLPAAVPEPVTSGLLGVGLLAVACYRRKVLAVSEHRPRPVRG